ncbi:VWA domain-containing protein [Massilia sp. DJPM01]|uniref:nitric oxide reductase activation protein NorD n=1 Tax=Massilia sp. DJPM01 TaxID=3024404 RepID=UPI00259D3D98|nr:VWA domain-containing protein [Massilia sp. DJPM01]MDM5181513.1 VWA domain-containing protein [Massilia sp. DJPM01]
MAEAEDLITDAARHATIFVQAYWRRHRPRPGPAQLALCDVAARLDLLAHAVFGRSFRLRPSQPPAPRTFLDKLLRRHQAPPPASALPGTDGHSIWLPRAIASGIDGVEQRALARYRLLLLQQAMRATRGSALHYPQRESAWVQACYHLLEARAADAALERLLPGIAGALQDWRLTALAARPLLRTLAPSLHALEQALQAVLAGTRADEAGTPLQVLEQARRMAPGLAAPGGQVQGRVLAGDGWLGEFMPAPASVAAASRAGERDDDSGARRSARLARRPRARRQDEDDEPPPGPMMVQTAQPHEQAEDALGVQRPTDRDTSTAAEEFADALSELPEARLVSTPGAAREVLLSDDPPDAQARRQGMAPQGADGEACPYPEWDWKTRCYRDPGAIVTVRTALPGAQATLDAILRRQAPLLRAVRRQFELLRAQRTRLRQQLDGDAIDLQGWIDNQAQLLAGGKLDQRLYEAERRGRRDLAVMLLVDISGSTDSWVSGQCRVIDVEREALLMVCAALQGLGEPFSVLGFSGEGPGGVVVRAIKHFAEPYGNDVALRIAGLEPENYTRAGAALRHASAVLMRQAARHKLLIVISDGKPNDVDQYDGRYGVEDLRQAVTEARLQGISPFCLTIDRQAASYLPAVFGEHAYALLQRAELLPTVLLGWLRKLVAA